MVLELLQQRHDFILKIILWRIDTEERSKSEGSL